MPGSGKHRHRRGEILRSDCSDALAGFFRSNVRAIPIDGETKTLFKGETRGVTQFLDSGGRVGLGVTDIPRSRRPVRGRQVDAFDLLEQLPRFVQRVAVAVSRIEDPARN